MVVESRMPTRMHRLKTSTRFEKDARMLHMEQISADAWANLIADGSVTPAEDDADITNEAPGDYDIDASAVLGAMRSDVT